MKNMFLKILVNKIFFLLNNLILWRLLPIVKLWEAKLFFDTASFRAYKRGQLRWFDNERLLNDLIKKSINKYKSDLFIDVGANFGMHSFEIREKFNDIKIYAFEPNKFLVSIMKKTIRRTQKQIKIINVALGNKNENSTLHLNYFSTGFSSINNYENLNISLPIKVQKLDTFNFYKNFSNIGIKVDIEGFEANFLKGAKNTLQYVNWIIIELDNSKLIYSESSVEKCVALLKENNFDVKQIDYTAQTFSLKNTNIYSKETHDYYAFKNVT